MIDVNYFKSRSNVDDRGCWVWTGFTQNGRARMCVRAGRGTPVRTWNAARVSYCTANEVMLPETVHVCHSCDNAMCVNPVHLWIGDHGDNMRDMVSKGRAQRGALRYNAKLSHGSAMDILSSRLSNTELAVLHGVSVTTIKQVKAMKHWTVRDKD